MCIKILYIHIIYIYYNLTTYIKKQNGKYIKNILYISQRLGFFLNTFIVILVLIFNLIFIIIHNNVI